MDNFILSERTYLATDHNLDLQLGISRCKNDLTVVILINSPQERALFTRLEFAVIKGEPEETPTTILTYDMVCETGTNSSRVLLMKKWTVLNPTNRWLVNDTLTLSITASARFLAEKSKEPEIPGLLSIGKVSDMIIKASDGIEFKVHKAILTSRSEYFKSMFDHDNVLESKQNLIEITDFKSNVVHEMLCYLYANEVHLDDCVVELLALSDKYNMKELQIKCENRLARDLKSDNALDVLHIAEMYNAKYLATKTRKFILKNSRQVMSGHKTELGDMLKALDSETLGELVSEIAEQSKKKLKLVTREDHDSTIELVAKFNTLEHLKYIWGDQGRGADSLRTRPAGLTAPSLKMEDVRMNVQRWWRDNV